MNYKSAIARFLARRCLLVMAAIVLSMSIGIRIAYTQAEGTGDLIFTAPPSFSEGQVRTQILVRSAYLQRYDLFTTASFSIDEASESTQISTQDSAPMTFFVIVNPSFASDLNLIQQTLSVYFDAYFRPDDKVIFFIQGPSQFETREPADLDAIRAVIADLTISNTYTALGSDMVTSILARLRTELEATPTHTFQALFVASYFMTSDTPSIGRSFALLNVPLHVVQAHRFREDSTSQMRALAENGGGLFVDNRDGRFIQTGSIITAASTLKLAYDAIESSRTVYTLTYRPSRRDLLVNPEVALTLQLDTNRQMSRDFTYERVFTPPRIEFADDTLSLRRTPTRQGDQIIFDNTFQQLRARIQFPDAVPRQLASVRVEVLNTATNQILQSALELQPEIDPLGYFDITFSLQAFSQPETTTPIRVTLMGTDELGLTTVANLEGRVTVVALPILPTAIPSLTITPLPTTTTVPTAALMPTLTVTSLPALQTSAPAIPAAAIENPIVLLFTGIILLLVVIIVGMLFGRRQSRQRRQKAPTNRASRADVFGMDLDTDNGQLAILPAANAAPNLPVKAPEEDKLYGRLIVIKGLTVLEILITREEFVIGRSETSNCDYVIPAPFISPRHCMLTHRNGKFVIRDLKSKNGVFVNGERIPVDRDVIVPIGSELGITQNINVELWDPNTVVSSRRSQPSTASQTHATQTRGSRSDFLFRAVPGIRYVDDDEAVDDDYSPL